MHKLIGNKWAKIANYIPGRSEKRTKNFFYSEMRRQCMKVKNFDFSK